ncbi:MAG: TerC/Alx family metal homeostasis membrane protein [Actinobacteria bacterium]|uniref:Unannotated protein n=1 Tax=freshwater metagenome TaxID=449393 RepID=A0A6J7LB53_9ZZZZ|nr:TerC/Alx family metal homeostasis membrane protein [Actinomycetota bacterium]
MIVSTTAWAVTVVALIALMAFDFWIVERRPRPFTSADAARWVVVYVSLAALFALYLLWQYGSRPAGEFVAGYITEYSLSVDNLFVFVVLMASFSVPAALQHRVLLIGVVLALILRTGLIFIGAAALTRFTATFYLFGAFLIWTAWRVATSHEEEVDPEGNALVRWVEKRFPVTREYHGHKWTTTLNGVRYITPMALVILAIGTTDLLFAVDSIPAVFGLTSTTYIVFTVNAFALMGLRQLFFLLHGLLGRLVYLNRGLALILAFIGVKLIFEAMHSTTSLPVPQIGIAVSLAVIVGILAVTVAASLLAVRRNPTLLEGSADSPEGAGADD